MATSDVRSYLKKESKLLAESSETRQYHKSSYTIFEGLSNERHGELVKVEKNASLLKTKSIFGSKSLTKRGRSTSTNG
jgi:hypothetical protein